MNVLFTCALSLRRSPMPIRNCCCYPRWKSCLDAVDWPSKYHSYRVCWLPRTRGWKLACRRTFRRCEPFWTSSDYHCKEGVWLPCTEYKRYDGIMSRSSAKRLIMDLKFLVIYIVRIFREATAGSMPRALSPNSSLDSACPILLSSTLISNFLQRMVHGILDDQKRWRRWRRRSCPGLHWIPCLWLWTSQGPPWIWKGLCEERQNCSCPLWGWKDRAQYLGRQEARLGYSFWTLPPSRRRQQPEYQTK